MVWSRTIIPRHAFTLWLFINNRLPTKMRLKNYTLQLDTTCPRCGQAQENDVHIIYDCFYAQEIWNEISKWRSIPITSHQGILQHLTHSRGKSAMKQISFAVYAATVYNLWQARNSFIFQQQTTTAQQMVKWVKEQVIYRILYLDRISNKFRHYIDSLLI